MHNYAECVLVNLHLCRSSTRRLNILDQVNDLPVKFTFSEPDSIVHSSLVRLATQGKASLYLWMLYRFLHDEQFRKGSRFYVSKHKGSLVKTEDLSNDFTVRFIVTSSIQSLDK